MAMPMPPGFTALGGRRDTSRTVLLVASFGAFLAFIDSTIVNVAFPSIQRSFPTSSIGDLSWVLNAYNVVFAAILVAGGRVADLIGRRRTFALGVAIFTLASGLCAAANSVDELILWRGIQAIGAALLVPASLAIVIEAFAGDRRSHAIGLWGAAAAFASGIGPPLGGALVGAGGWRWAFLVNLPLGAAAIVLSRRELVESRAPGHRRMPDFLGLALLAASLGSLTVGIVKIPEWGTLSSGVGIATGAAVILFALFAAQSRRHRSPAIDPELLTIPVFRLGAILTVVTGAGFYSYLLTHILWLRYVWHYSVLGSGLAVMPGALVATVVAGAGGRIADKRGYRVLMVPGAFIWAGSFLWYLEVVDLTPHFWSQWLPGQVLSGLGVGLTLPILTSAGLSAVPGGRYALASGLSSAARQLGGVLGIAVLVVIVGTPDASGATLFRHGWIFSACCFLVVGLGAIFLRPGTPVEDSVELDGDAVQIPLTAAEAAPMPTSTAKDVSVSALLRGIPMFSELSATTLAQLVRASRTVEVRGGYHLFELGDKADAVYVVRSGRVEIVGADGTVLRIVGPGHVVGELALLTGGTRSATVRAFRDSTLVRLTKTAFDRIVNADSVATRALAASLAEQLQVSGSRAGRSQDRAQTPRPAVITVLAPTAADSKAITAAIVDELRGHRASVAAPRRVTPAELLELELSTEHVVLDAGRLGTHTQWSSFALRQADRIVVVADRQTPAEHLHPLRRLRSVDLVILDAPLRIDELRAASDAQTVVARTRSELDDITKRLAARYAARSVALVLSGGGARALSHLGVIAELQAAGIEIGRVTGASMGSYIGALLAMGLPVEEIDAWCHEEYVRRNPVGGYRLPTISLSSGKNGHSMLERTFGDLRIEQLPRMYAASSADLYAATLRIHDTGLVKDAVGPSISLPAVFPPYSLDGRFYVDGGVLDNAPTEPLVVRDEGPIIVVDVAGSSRPVDPTRTPSIAENLMRSLMMAGAQQAQRTAGNATMVIRPPGQGVGLLEFHQIDRLVESGRAAARAALEEHGHLLG